MVNYYYLSQRIQDDPHGVIPELCSTDVDPLTVDVPFVVIRAVWTDSLCFRKYNNSAIILFWVARSQKQGSTVCSPRQNIRLIMNFFKVRSCNYYSYRVC